MSKQFNRDQLLAALDEIGRAAVENRRVLEVVIYGGSALMLASNFRYASEDVDIAEIERPWPDWLRQAVSAIAARNGWSEDWLNDAVAFHLSPLASVDSDHWLFGSFPRNGADAGLKVYVPTAEYLLALKLKAMRVTDPVKGRQETSDIANRAKVLDLGTPQDALDVLPKFFPKTASDSAKQRFLLKHIWNEDAHDAPEYPARRF